MFFWYSKFKFPVTNSYYNPCYRFGRRELLLKVTAVATEMPVNFPYKRLFMKEPSYYFDNLKSRTYLISDEFLPDNSARMDWKLDGRCVYICMKSDAYSKCNMLTDYYTEKPRMQAHLKGHKSPFEVWNNDKQRDRIIDTVKKSGLKLTAKNLREGIYKSVSECSNFKITTAQEMYLFFEARVVFDPFGGWGDRMIGAAAAGVQKYCCTDINQDLIAGYNEMANMLRKKSKTQIGYRFMPIERYSVDEFKSDFGSEAPDCIFTSPPFFDYEIYSPDRDRERSGSAQTDNETDTKLGNAKAVERHGHYEDWRDNWLYPVLDRVWGMLKPGGYFAIHLSGVRCRMSVDIQEFMATRGRKFRGIIACGFDKKFPLPVLVWQKNKKDHILLLPPAKLTTDKS